MSARYLAGRVGWTLLTVAFVVVLNFFLFRVMGDPSRLLKDPRLSQASLAAMQARFGLDEPVINCFASLNPLRLEAGTCGVNPLETQFFSYVRNLFRGDFGISFHSQRPVLELLGERLGNTVLLIGAGQVLAILFGVLLGLLAAYRARTLLDYTALVGSLAAWSIPTFWLGILLLFWGSTSFGLPLGGKGTIGGSFETPWGGLLDLGRHLLLPTLTFTIVFIGEYMLIMRSTVLDVLSEDYILTAKAKGLTTFQILKDHALRNAMLPIVTIVALNLGFTVAGAIQIETVFSWPGLGLTVFEAVQRRDYPVLQGAFLLIAVSVIAANLLADLLYALLDPRVRAGA